MMKVFAIAKYTAIESYRDKFIIFVALLMLSGIPLGAFISNLTLYGTETVLPAVVVAMISISVAVVSVLYVNIASRRELDGRIMHVILSAPVSNISYLAGKVLGFWITSAFYVILGFAIMLILGIASLKLVAIASISTLLMQFIVISCSLFFALLLNSLAASVMISIMAWILFNVTQAVWIMSVYAPDAFTRLTGSFIYYVMPNYGRYDFKNQLLYNIDIPMSDFLILIPYTVLYTAIILMAAFVDFSRKEY